MIEKKFSKSFDEALQQSYRFHTGFVEDKTSFTGFSPKFADPFGADLLTDIEAADALPTYEDDLGELGLLTDAVNDKMEECRAHYQKLLVYLELAWPGDEVIARNFGNTLYTAASYSQLKLINLMQNAYLQANSTDYKTDLIAAGFLQVDITLLDTLADGLTTANNAQEDFKSKSFARTQARVVAFNKVWDSMAMISNSSKVVFKENPAKVEYYLLYPDTPNPNAPPAPTNLDWKSDINTFAWDAILTATSYQLMYKMAAGEEWLEAYLGVLASAVFDPGAGEWDFKVRARNASGYGAYSATLNILVPGGLAAPDNVAVVYLPAPDDYLSLTWDAVSGASSYKLYHSIVNIGQPSGPYVSPEFPISSPHVVNNPISGKRYYYKVASCAPGKMSEPSEAAYVDVS